MKRFLLLLCALLPALISVTAQDCNVVSRVEWKARPPKHNRTALSQNPPPYVVVHHSDTPNCTTEEKCKSKVKGIQNYHMDSNHWDDIGYNFLIGTEGTVFEGRGWDIQGAHAPKVNPRSIGICLIGSYQGNVDLTIKLNIYPPEIQLSSLKNLIKCGLNNGKIKSDYGLIGHRQVRSTTCPGDKLYQLVTEMDRYDPNPE